MAPRSIRHVLEDIRAAIIEMESATRGRTFEEFRTSWVLTHAIQRGIEIVSEAVRHIPEASTLSQPSIPWAAIRAIGNVLRHEYHRVVDSVVWAVVVQDLPPLRTAIEAMLRDLDGLSQETNTTGEAPAGACDASEP